MDAVFHLSTCSRTWYVIFQQIRMENRNIHKYFSLGMSLDARWFKDYQVYHEGQIRGQKGQFSAEKHVPQYFVVFLFQIVRMKRFWILE